jgi:hypothetical protein
MYVNCVQDFNFYGKPLRVTFARKKSDITTKAEGGEPPKRERHSKKGMVPVSRNTSGSFSSVMVALSGEPFHGHIII